MGLLKFNLNRERRRKAIISQAKKEDNIIYGGRAIKAQIGAFARPTSDFDIYSNNPDVSAKNTEKKFDKIHGKNDFYVKKALYKDTRKVFYRGPDGKRGTSDDVGIVDYTKKRGKKDFIIIGGVKYSPIKTIAKNKKKILKDPEFSYRHKKDADDIRRIKFRRSLI